MLAVGTLVATAGCLLRDLGDLGDDWVGGPLVGIQEIPALIEVVKSYDTN